MSGGAIVEAAGIGEDAAVRETVADGLRQAPLRADVDGLRAGETVLRRHGFDGRHRDVAAAAELAPPLDRLLARVTDLREADHDPVVPAIAEVKRDREVFRRTGTGAGGEGPAGDALPSRSCADGHRPGEDRMGVVGGGLVARVVPLRLGLDPAGLTGAGVERDQRAAAGAGLRPDLALASPDRGGAARGDDVDRTVHADEAGIVEDQGVRLVRSPAQGTTDLLHVEPGALGRAQQGDEVDLGHVEAGGEDADRGQAADPALAERPDDAVPRPPGRLAREGLAAVALGPDRVAHRRGVGDAGAEGEPGPAALPVADHLLHRSAGDPVLVDGGLEGARDVVAPAPRHPRDVEGRGGGLGDERREVALVDQVADIGLVDDGFEQPAGARVEAPAVEAVGRGRQADDAQVAALGAQGGQEAAVAGLGVAGDEMGFVYDHEVERVEVAGPVPDRLDAAEQHLCAGLAATEAGGIDTRRCLRPERQEFAVVLCDEFAAVGDDDDAMAGIAIEHLSHQGGDHQRLAGTGRQDDEARALLSCPGGIEGVEAGALIGAEIHRRRF
jgi:hypothetical protein